MFKPYTKCQEKLRQEICSPKTKKNDFSFTRRLRLISGILAVHNYYLNWWHRSKGHSCWRSDSTCGRARWSSSCGRSDRTRRRGKRRSRCGSKLRIGSPGWNAINFFDVLRTPSTLACMVLPAPSHAASTFTLETPWPGSALTSAGPWAFASTFTLETPGSALTSAGPWDAVSTFTRPCSTLACATRHDLRKTIVVQNDAVATPKHSTINASNGAVLMGRVDTDLTNNSFPSFSPALYPTLEQMGHKGQTA